MGKLLIGALIIACIAPLFVKDNEGRPIMTIEDWKLSFPAWVDETADELRSRGSDTDEPVGDTVYKWQDDEGQWHFSGEPPEGVEAEQMTMHGAVNVIPGMADGNDESAGTDTPADFSNPGVTAPGLSVSPDEIKDMMETVDSVKETLSGREAAIEEIGS